MIGKRRFQRVFALTTVTLTMLWFQPLSSWSAIIDFDTTIDSTNSFPSEGVTITDGPGGPATVTMVPGGIVRGFTVAGNSTLEMTGGTSTFLSGTQENATLIMRGGTIECSAFVCNLIDYISLVSVRDNSSIHVFGGIISGIIGIAENGNAHFYGRNLTLSVGPGGALVDGELASGEPIGGFGIISLEPLLELSTRIFLHEIPEPGTMTLAVASFISMALVRRRNRWICL